MAALDAIREALPEAARDVKLNLQAVLGPDAQVALTPEQRWGVAVAAAAAARNARLLAALVEDARAAVAPAVVDDGLAAAALMAMNNVYYRFRHIVGKPTYSERPARLRMNRMARPLGGKLDFELFSLAASAVNNCEACVRAHEEAVIKGGLGEEAVHDAVRIAAVVQAAAVSLDLAPVAGSAAVG